METNNRLEDFINANRDEFDFREPSPEVWEKISAKKSKPRVITMRGYIIRAAAVIAIIVATSAVLLQSNFLNRVNYTLNTNDPELKELMEAEAFYAQQVDSKLKEIQKCYYTFPELKEEVETDLNELEAMYKVLKIDLRENISSKTVIEAMIENNRYRLKLVDDVLEQINC
jgi:uncharacterized membrane protein YhiD involved in acid resistance